MEGARREALQRSGQGVLCVIIATTREIYQSLRDALPIRGGVALRFVDRIVFAGRECTGLTRWSPRGFATIGVCRGQSLDATVDTLLHEYAHALSGCPTHRRRWSDAFGKAYRVYELFQPQEEV